MELINFKVKNFKSFKDEVVFEFKNNISFLLGLNGSGKSNFLEAIKCFNSESEIDFKKYSYVGDEEKTQENILLSFCIKNSKELTEKISQKILKIFENKIIEFENNFKQHCNLKNYENGLIELFKKNLNNFLEKVSEFTFVKEVNEKSKNFSYTVFNSKKEDFFISTFMKNLINHFDKNGGTKISINKNILEIKNLQPVNIQTVNTLTSFSNYLKSSTIWVEEKENIKLFLDFTNLINIHYWKYSDEYILPDKIDLKKLVSTNGDSCKPFRNCLYGLNIKIEEINEIILGKNNSNGSNIEDMLNDKINEKINSIWKDFKKEKLAIDFKINGTNIIVNLKHKSSYDHKPLYFESDGYKQFFSILFTIDFNCKKDLLLLIDEPETHLHPSSIIDLKEILYKFAESNYLIACTHSVYLVDISRLDKYYLVTKPQKASQIKNVENDLEKFPSLITQAFGTDIFSSYMFKKYCFFVEGLTDLKILNKILGKNIKDFQIIIFHGGSIVPYVESYKEMYPKEYFSKNCYVLLDSDDSGKRNKENLKKESIINEENIVLTDDILEHECGEIEDIYKDKILKSYILEKDKCENDHQKKELKTKYCDNIDENCDSKKIEQARKKLFKIINFIGEKDE